MRAAILSTGSEVVRGDTVDTNAAWLARELVELGFEIRRHQTELDEHTPIVEALRHLAKDADVIVMTGGLGPTSDDGTRPALATLLGEPLMEDATSRAQVEEWFRLRKRVLVPTNLQQAMFPRGTTPLPNRHGTAPGIAAHWNDTEIFCLPGVPREMRGMFAEEVRPRLIALGSTAPRVHAFHTIGLGEGMVAEQLADLERLYPVVLGYRAHLPGVTVKVAEAGAEAAWLEAIAEARRRLAPRIWGEGDVTLAQRVSAQLRTRGETVALAESFTGGAASDLLVQVPGASDWFMGAVVCYQDHHKQKLLGVSSALLAREGAVSMDVALALAEGARDELGATWGIGYTGFAGPAGADDRRPIGTAFIAVAGPNGAVGEEHQLMGDRDTIRQRGAYFGLWLLLRQLDERH